MKSAVGRLRNGAAGTLALLVALGATTAVTDSVAKEPEALICIAPWYSQALNGGDLADLDSVLDPSIELAATLARGGYQVEILLGNDKEVAAVEIPKVRARIEELNAELKKERALSIVCKQSFANATDLAQQVDQWTVSGFGGKNRAPFGIVVFNGHGETREGERHHFLTPSDGPGQGGLSLNSIADAAFRLRVRLLIVSDTCRTRNGQLEGAIVPQPVPGVSGIAAIDVAADAASAFDALATTRYPIEFGAYPMLDSGFLFSCMPGYEIDDDPSVSVTQALADGFSVVGEGRDRSLKLKTPTASDANAKPLNATLLESLLYSREFVETNSKHRFRPPFDYGPFSARSVIYSRESKYIYPTNEPARFPVRGMAAASVNMTISEAGVGSNTGEGAFIVSRPSSPNAGYAYIAFGERSVAVDNDPRGGHDWLEVDIEAIGPPGAGASFLLTPGRNPENRDNPQLAYLRTWKEMVDNPYALRSGERKRLRVPINYVERGWKLEILGVGTTNGSSDPMQDAHWNPSVQLLVRSVRLFNAAGVREVELVPDLPAWTRTLPRGATVLDLTPRMWFGQAMRSNKGISVDQVHFDRDWSIGWRISAWGDLPKGPFSYGASAEVYPSSDVAPRSHMLRVRIANVSGVEGKLGIRVSSAEQPLLTADSEVEANGSWEAELPFTKAGDIDEISIISADCTEFYVDEIALIGRP